MPNREMSDRKPQDRVPQAWSNRVGRSMTSASGASPGCHSSRSSRISGRWSSGRQRSTIRALAIPRLARRSSRRPRRSSSRARRSWRTRSTLSSGAFASRLPPSRCRSQPARGAARRPVRRAVPGPARGRRGIPGMAVSGRDRAPPWPARRPAPLGRGAVRRQEGGAVEVPGWSLGML